jgi:hypothetical protein
MMSDSARISSINNQVSTVPLHGMSSFLSDHFQLRLVVRGSDLSRNDLDSNKSEQLKVVIDSLSFESERQWGRSS